MKNSELFKNYGSEQWVIEQNLCFLLQEYKELVESGKWQGVNLVGFVKQFMNEETLVETGFAEMSKINTLEAKAIDVTAIDVTEFHPRKDLAQHEPEDNRII